MLTKEKSLIEMSVTKNLESEIVDFTSPGIRGILKRVDKEKLGHMEEIRLRAGRTLIVQNCYGDWLVDREGRLVKETGMPFVVCQEEIVKTLELMSENSIYAYQDEIKNGFITLKGGHRVGISGKVVLEGQAVKNIKDISGLNIRISREIPGCAEKIIRHLIKNGSEVYNTLIISPPQCGKTTILRDITRLLSSGIGELSFQGIKTGVVDERSEIAACYKGVPQNDIGPRADVLDACPKSVGMAMLLRSMSPQVIITDEIGNRGDKDAILQVIHAGVKIITTAHGYNISELKSRREVLELMEEKIFERYIVLSNKKGPGTVEEIMDGSSLQRLRAGGWSE